MASQRKSLPGNPCSFFGGTFNSHQPAGEKREKEEAGQTAWEFGNSGKGASLSLVQSTSTIGKSVVLQVEIAFFVDVSCLAVVKVGCIKNYKLTKCFFYSYILEFAIAEIHCTTYYYTNLTTDKETVN